MDGYKELLGMWISPNEGAKFWLSVLTEIHNRGVKDILIACVDGLTGFPNAIETVFPKTQVQLCIVHMVRNSVAFASWQQRKQVCADLKAIYAAATESEAEFNLELFAEKWDKQYPSISTRLGAVIGRTLSPSLFFYLRFAGRFIPSMRLSQ